MHFKFDSAVVERARGRTSARRRRFEGRSQRELLIEGHCDERGTEEYNRSLGERRALALREELTKAGVERRASAPVSFGKDQPVDPGHDEAAWSKNRRGEFILLHPKAGA